jgi:hypothetical protein
MSDIVEMLQTPTGCNPPSKRELAAAKEIERLRKALRDIADDGKNCEGYCRRQAARAIRAPVSRS